MKILLVEKEGSFGDVLFMLLKSFKYEVVASKGANDALTAIKETSPDLILIDRDLQDKDGLEIPYKIVNKQYGVVEARIDNLSQAQIYLYQMNALLVNDEWKKVAGIPEGSDIPDNVLSMFDVKNDKQ